MPDLHNNAAIGVFDSGVGGLSVLQAIQQQLPEEDLIYIADSGNAPYGDRDVEFIVDRATHLTELLLACGVKALVIACNTVSVVAIGKIRAWCPVPVIAMEPAIKPASQNTKSGVVGVLATRQTIASPSVARLCETHGNNLEILLQPCPGLVECVERAELFSAATRALLVEYISPLLAAGADTLVLGCTHYPFLTPLIRDIVGPNIAIIDPAAAIAMQLVRRLGDNRIWGQRTKTSGARFFSSARTANAEAIISSLWGKSITVEAIGTV